ncbi:DUF3037 domain-containing protein [Pedobacter sp. HMF7647]|uniref:DUF3037 domain-containing protein n=1 Tax=Hufsiella arboris TaxID=2695275 RepID=A0A7K1YCU6_9SPHI|nr:DUF3037 domain-containing protein [Hufsiella arboris]MXV52403.1 DUF3037 domain-containing protein [Hufsiella arboris]
MQEKHVFEYAVIRVVPRVEREEFINAGVILYCRQQRFLKAMIRLNEGRYHCFSPEIGAEEIKRYLKTFEDISEGNRDGGPIAELDIASRFRWLTAMRSTMVQSSRVHPGLCSDAEAALKKLFEQLVL